MFITFQRRPRAVLELRMTSWMTSHARNFPLAAPIRRIVIHSLTEPAYDPGAPVRLQINPPTSRNPMDEQQPQTIRITLDENIAQGEYVNFANIIHSPSEFVIDLGRIMPGRTDVKVYSRVIMTPLHAKQLLQALAQNIAIFEQKFGEIRIDGASVFSSNEPSN